MELLSALESGIIPSAPTPDAEPAPSSVEVARRWAMAFGLRQGNSRGPTVGALVPVVAQWAAQHGWTGPEHRWLGAGLRAAGLSRRCVSGVERTTRLLLHPESAALLKRLCREAWAPARPPGDPLQKWKPRPRPRKLEPGLFHLELERAERRAGRPTALVDSTGRVWPSARHAAAALGCVQSTIAAAAPASGGWGAKPAKGLLWRRMLPEEVAAVPATALVGERLAHAGWALACICRTAHE